MENSTQIIKEAQRVLEDWKKHRQYFESRAYRRKMRKLYTNRRALKKMIRSQEKRFAMSLTKLDKPPEDKALSFESVMEWFLTWRLKLADFPETMWCDGVQDLELTREGKR